jgi:hypothetical protein
MAVGELCVACRKALVSQLSDPLNLSNEAKIQKAGYTTNARLTSNMRSIQQIFLFTEYSGMMKETSLKGLKLNFINKCNGWSPISDGWLPPSLKRKYCRRFL